MAGSSRIPAGRSPFYRDNEGGPGLTYGPDEIAAQFDVLNAEVAELQAEASSERDFTIRNLVGDGATIETVEEDDEVIVFDVTAANGFLSFAAPGTFPTGRQFQIHVTGDLFANTLRLELQFPGLTLEGGLDELDVFPGDRIRVLNVGSVWHATYDGCNPTIKSGQTAGAMQLFPGLSAVLSSTTTMPKLAWGDILTAGDASGPCAINLYNTTDTLASVCFIDPDNPTTKDWRFRMPGQSGVFGDSTMQVVFDPTAGRGKLLVLGNGASQADVMSGDGAIVANMGADGNFDPGHRGIEVRTGTIGNRAFAALESGILSTNQTAAVGGDAPGTTTHKMPWYDTDGTTVIGYVELKPDWV